MAIGPFRAEVGTEYLVDGKVRQFSAGSGIVFSVIVSFGLFPLSLMHGAMPVVGIPSVFSRVTFLIPYHVYLCAYVFDVMRFHGILCFHSIACFRGIVCCHGSVCFHDTV